MLLTADRKTKDQGQNPVTYSWLIQCPPGLANVMKKEMVYAGCIDRKQDLFIKRQRNHDLLFANRLKNPEGAERLRLAESVLRCPLFGRFKISKRQLEIMASELRELGPRRLVVTVAGRVFQRQDLARWITKEMSARGYEFDQNIEDEVWMFCVDEAYYFGVPVVKSRDAEGRSDRVAERRGSLPPPVAAALAFAGMPKNDDVVLDPVCGSGSVLAEVLAYAPEASVTGVDIDREAIEIARENLGGAASLIHGDSRRVAGALEGRVTLVVANLPFGVRYGTKQDNPRLYREILAEMLRLRAPSGWRGIFFTSDVESFRAATREISGVVVEESFKVQVRGELASAFRVTAR